MNYLSVEMIRVALRTIKDDFFLLSSSYFLPCFRQFISIEQVRSDLNIF